MASNIDPSKPTSQRAYTADVRANFAAAKQEIEALQVASGITFVQSGIATSDHRASRTLQAKVSEVELSVTDGKNSNGTAVAGDGTTDDTTGIQRVIDAAGDGDTIIFPRGLTFSITGLTVSNKNRVRLTGGGKLLLRGASNNAISIEGTCDGIEIDHLTIEGDDLESQRAIRQNNGQTVSNLHIHHNIIKDLGIAIDLNAETSGSCVRAKIHHNTIENILGTDSGEGYGIHLNNLEHAVVSENTIKGCQRHSIYHSNGSHNQIVNNTIIDHRSGVAASVTRAAINVARDSHGILVQGNIIEGAADCAISVLGETATPSVCRAVNVIGNIIRNYQNAVSIIQVGEQATQSATTVQGVLIANNVLEIDASLTGNVSLIQIHHGKSVTVRGNTLTVYGLNGDSVTCINIGSAHVSDDDYMDDIVCEGNTFDVIAGAGSVANVRAFRVQSVVCGANGIAARIKGNYYAKLRNGAAFNYVPLTLAAANTNPQLVLEEFDSVSDDKGNAGATLTVFQSEKVNIWNTPLVTADRTVTLSSTNAYKGAWFRIVRTAAATGAFNLNVVHSAGTKALAAGQWCDVTYDPTLGWVLAASGSL